MTESGWKPDPAGRGDWRYHDGKSWTDRIASGGAASVDPMGTSGITDDSTQAEETDVPTSAIGTAEEPTASWSTDSADTPATNKPARKTMTLPIGISAIVALVIVAVALGLGAAIQSSATASERDDLQADLDASRAELNDANAELDDRQEQKEADEAAAARSKQERLDKQEEAKTAERKAQEKAAADAQAAADAAASEATARATIDRDGVYEIGVDKDPGRYKTDGGSNCYYATLSSPDTSDIENNNLLDNAPATVDLVAGKFFETQGCGVWTKTG